MLELAQPSLFGFHCPRCGWMPWATDDDICFPCDVAEYQASHEAEVSSANLFDLMEAETVA